MLKPYLEELFQGNKLSRAQATEAMQILLAGDAKPAQAAALIRKVEGA